MRACVRACVCVCVCVWVGGFVQVRQGGMCWHARLPRTRRRHLQRCCAGRSPECPSRIHPFLCFLVGISPKHLGLAQSACKLHTGSPPIPLVRCKTHYIFASRIHARAVSRSECLATDSKLSHANEVQSRKCNASRLSLLASLSRHGAYTRHSSEPAQVLEQPVLRPSRESLQTQGSTDAQGAFERMVLGVPRV